MYYHIDKIRGITLNRIPMLNTERRKLLQKFMESENLIELKIFNKIHTYNSALYIDEEIFIRYMKALNIHFGLKQKPELYSKCHIPSCKKSFIIENIQQFLELTIQRKIEDNARLQRKRKQMNSFNMPLPTDFEDKKLMAIDFEFIPKGNNVEPLEMGICIQHNGMRTFFNYSFVNTDKENFNFGETINVDKSTILSIFKEHFDGVDYLVGHNIQSELKVLREFDVDESIFDNVKFIDTSYITKNEFHFLNTDHVKNQTASLRTSLRTFDIPHIRLHVAGNDAAYTLDLLNQLVLHKANYQSKKDNDKINIKSKYKRI